MNFAVRSFMGIRDLGGDIGQFYLNLQEKSRQKVKG